MNKKAQFYILTAVVLLSITFGLFTSKKLISSPDKTFENLVENYVKEAPFAANKGDLDDFNERFYDFASSKDHAFQMLSIFVSKSNISVESFMKSTIFINQYNLSFNQTIILDLVDEITISTQEDQYVINTENYGINTLFISAKEGNRQVRIE